MTGCLCRHVYWMWQAQTPDSQSLVVGCVFSAATRVLFITQCQVTNTGYQSGLFLLLLGQHLLPSMTLQNYYSRSPWGFYGVSPNFFKSAENYFTGYLFFFFLAKGWRGDVGGEGQFEPVGVKCRSTRSLRGTEGVQAFQLGTVCAEGVVLEALEGVGELGTVCFNLP